MLKKKAGLYMEAEAGGSTGAGVPQAGAGTDVSALKAQIARLQSELEQFKAREREWKQMQSGQDKTINGQIERINQLEAELQQHKSTVVGNSQAMDALTQEKESLLSKLAELESQTAATTELESKLQKTQTDLDRFQIVAQKYPQLMPFAAQGALPSAEDNEQFEAKLEALAASVTGVAGSMAQHQVDGSRPAGPPPASDATTPEALKQQVDAAIREGDFAKADQLNRRLLRLQEKN